MIILMTGTNVSVCVRDTDLMEGNKRFYAFSNNGYFDPENDFKPCFNKQGEKPRRRLYDGFADEYNSMLGDADAMFDKVKTVYEKKFAAMAARENPTPAVPSPAPTPAPAPRGGGLGSQLEELMLKVLAEQSVDKVIDMAKPLLEKHITETFGVLPQIHEVITPAGKVEIKGTVHEKFDTVLSLVNADIPVFLTGAAGTGKNVLCKQIAEALHLEFYFSNAVTQEYKLTGFIDANGTFHETQFFKAFTEGGLFMLDEMDASIPEVLIILNAAIANRYFDFPTGRVQAHENFRLIAAGNTFGTGADIEYTGRFQLDAASLDRFALVEIDYSPAIENALAMGDTELVEFVRAFRKSCADAGIKHLATYRAIERMRKLRDCMDMIEVLKMCLVKSLCRDDMRIIVDSMRSSLNADNKYFIGFKKMAA